MHKSMKHSKVYHFADDTNLFHSHCNLKSLRKQANEDLALLFDWLCADKLSLNSDKTEFILFHGRSAKKDRITLTINPTSHRVFRATPHIGPPIFSQQLLVRLP